MIRISKKEDNALLFSAYLARNYQQKLISIQEVSKELATSASFLRQIAQSLKKADLVESKEGATGGYKLKKAPSQTTVGEIIRAVSGPIMQASRLTSVRKRSKESLVWQRIALEVVRTLDTITLNKL